MNSGVTPKHGFPSLFPTTKSPIIVNCVNSVVLDLNPIIVLTGYKLKPLCTPMGGITVNYFVEHLYRVPRSTPSCRNDVLNLLDDLVSVANLNPLAYDEIHELINECDDLFYKIMDSVFSAMDLTDVDMFERFCFKRWVDQHHALFTLQ